jgi:hypothetical protein
MRLIIAVDFGMQTGKAHEQGRPRAGMPKDEELAARKKGAGFGNFLGSDGRDGIAVFLLRFTAQENFCGKFQAIQQGLFLLTA